MKKILITSLLVALSANVYATDEVPVEGTVELSAEQLAEIDSIVADLGRSNRSKSRSS
ncbi:hypothetical protein ACLKMH_14420 [Psychromonas sp. KJ10-10]|uniref:hypothetical protein n=1 Tax=Psychromonas sp. KJ10-10 TaxID=3391823 RepID=UPI0039B468AF